MIKEGRAYLQGPSGYVYGLPLVMMDVTREVMTAASRSGEYSAPINQFHRLRDVYLLYGPETRWDGSDPPAPAYWMNQLGGPTAQPWTRRPSPSTLAPSSANQPSDPIRAVTSTPIGPGVSR